MARVTPESDRMARNPSAGSWEARPALAWVIRVGLVIVPLTASWMSVRHAVRVVPRPAEAGPTAAWVAGVVGLSMVVYQLTRRVLRRFSSLGVLYRLSLTFPDAAPSRLGAALRSGRLDGLHQSMRAEGGDLEPKLKARRIVDLVALVGRREILTRGHGDRVRAFSEQIGSEMGLPDADIEKLRWAALLHDVGTLDVPDRILGHRGPLDEADRRIVEEHPAHAIGYMEPFGDWLGEWLLAATEHHERWDGTGYPLGLAGEEISRAGRIVAVADAYDAMTSTRSYRKPISPAAARQELVDNAGTQFDPVVVRAFLNVGIRRSRAGLGPLGALMELPAQLGALTPAVTASAGVAAAGTVALVASTMGPSVSTAVELVPPSVERVVEEQTTPTTSTTTSTTSTTTSTTTRPVRSTTSTTSSSSTSTSTTVPPTTRPPTTTTSTTTTTSSTTSTTTTAPPAYPTVPTTTVGYPTVGP